MATTETASTKVVTGKVRFSYLHVFEPTIAPGSTEAKYSVSIIIPKSDKATLAKINNGIEAAKQVGKENKWKGKVPAVLKTPLRSGEEREDDPAYKDCYFINCTSKSRPGVVDKNLNEIISADDLKSGDYGKVSINFYPFDVNGNKGVAAGLNNLMLTEAGESLAGKASAKDDFGSEDDDFLG